ncbi:MAG: DUF1573 domain-containing protein [Rikenellaceae bacterium]|nr:DUF1573 domain-containing protein [Rikenellaceae bacterium]
MNFRLVAFLPFFLLVIGSCISCNNSAKEKRYVPQIVDDKRVADSAQIEFEEMVIDFGSVRRTESPSFFVEFTFTNVGKSPLVIYKADVTCSCISAEFPKQAFTSGQKGKIIVKVDTEGQEGFFSKSLIVKSNASNSYVLLRVNGTIK